MQWLRFSHVLAMSAWLGTAFAEIVIELVLTREKTSSRQKVLIDLHRVVDLVAEGPALVLTVLTGIGLIYARGYADHRWPAWLEDKLLCAAVVVVANVACIFFVRMRARRMHEIPLGASGTPLQQLRVQVWHYAVLSTFIGAPFAMIALWLAVNKP